MIARILAGLLTAVCISTYAGVEAVTPSASSGNRPAAIGGSAMPPATHLNPAWGTAADPNDSRRAGTPSNNPKSTNNSGVDSMRNGTGTSTGPRTGGGTGGAGGGTGRAGGGVGG